MTTCTCTCTLDIQERKGAIYLVPFTAALSLDETPVGGGEGCAVAAYYRTTVSFSLLRAAFHDSLQRKKRKPFVPRGERC